MKYVSVFAARPRLAALASALTLASTPCLALTASDVTGKMSDKERAGYLSGLIDMLSYQSVLGGDEKRALCVSNAFYKDAAMQERLVKALHRFPEKAPEGVVFAVMKQACGA